MAASSLPKAVIYCRILVREPGRSGILVNPGRGSEFSESSEPSRDGEPGVFRRRASGASRRPAPGMRNNAGQAAWPWNSGIDCPGGRGVVMDRMEEDIGRGSEERRLTTQGLVKDCPQAVLVAGW